MKYPITFPSSATANAEITQTWEALCGARGAECAIPKEFEGPGMGFSPEDFFSLALLNCFLATLKIYCHHSNVRFASIELSALLEVDLDEKSKKPVMKKFTLKAKIIAPSNRDRLELLCKKAFNSGFVLNSVTTEKILTLDWS